MIQSRRHNLAIALHSYIGIARSSFRCLVRIPAPSEERRPHQLVVRRAIGILLKMHRCEVSVSLEVRDLVCILLCQQRLQLLLLLPLLDEHVIAPVRLRRHITALDVLSAPLLVDHVPIGIFAIVLVLQGDDLVFLFILVV